MTIKTLTTILLLVASFLLLTACDSKVETNATNEQNLTAQVDITSGDTNTETGKSNEDSNSDGDATKSNNGTVTNDGTVTSGTNDDSTATSTVTLNFLTLTIEKTSLNKDENTTVKVMATYNDSISKDVTEEVKWIVSSDNIVKVIGNTLTALLDINVTLQAKLGSILSEKIILDIYWEVNGHTLPPKLDKEENDKTLLGIDSNNDGVRDDIERKVYATYPKAIQRAVMMQAFRAKQKMLADPDMVSNARVWEKEVTKYIDCTRYLYMYKRQARISRKEASLISEWQFDNKKRVKIYIDYNKALSGGVYSINKPKLEDCEFNIDKVSEMDK